LLLRFFRDVPFFAAALRGSFFGDFLPKKLKW
jgi:hypothetical protein